MGADYSGCSMGMCARTPARSSSLRQLRRALSRLTQCTRRAASRKAYARTGHHAISICYFVYAAYASRHVVAAGIYATIIKSIGDRYFRRDLRHLKRFKRYGRHAYRASAATSIIFHARLLRAINVVISRRSGMQAGICSMISGYRNRYLILSRFAASA